MSATPRRSLTANLKRKTDKVDNHQEAFADKVALREEALDMVGQARVLDLFAGKGAMFSAVWHRASRYLGADKEVTQALAHPAPVHHAAAQVMLRAINLRPFNVFDLDAYGSPWEEITVLAARRQLQPAELVAVVITDGAPRSAMLGHTANALAALAGEDPGAAGAHRRWPLLVRQGMAEAVRRMGGELVALRQSAASGGPRGMWYGVALLRGAAGRAPEAPGEGAQGGAVADGQEGRQEAPQKPRRAPRGAGPARKQEGRPEAP